ncbi:PaaI family thioesterase [Vibrio cholerae]|nr:PaaI family thioesterase [Vibrio cholerae]
MSINAPKNHQQCAVCCHPFFNDDSAIQFQLTADGGVVGQIVPTKKVQGYQGVVQGGVIATLHDAAMTHCLFARDVNAMTARLDVRYLKPIPLNSVIQVQAHCLMEKRGMYLMQSRILIGEDCYSSAEAKFM